MTDLGLVSIAIEGACDRWFGRPKTQNPYSFANAREWWEAWDLGWSDADWLIDVRGQEETARWLREEAA